MLLNAILIKTLAACAPFDVIKSRVMSEVSVHSLKAELSLNDQLSLKSSKTGAMEIFVTSLKNEGPSFLFKGWTPAFIRLGPNTVLLFVFLEVCNNSIFRTFLFAEVLYSK